MFIAVLQKLEESNSLSIFGWLKKLMRPYQGIPFNNKRQTIN
jgi:hypothetical protein